MKTCCRPGCIAKAEFEHAHCYGGKQINEEWAIIPVCTYHHRGAGLNKRFNKWIALKRATGDDLAKFPKRNFEQELSFLDYEFRRLYEADEILALDSYSRINI